MTVSQELIPGVRCVVTHPSKHGEFKKGDVIWLEEDGAIMNGTAKGWMAAEDVPEATEGMEVKSANPVAQELREWAIHDRDADMNNLSNRAWSAMSNYRRGAWSDWFQDHVHARVFALFVACALEDDSADQA